MIYLVFILVTLNLKDVVYNEIFGLYLPLRQYHACATRGFSSLL